MINSHKEVVNEIRDFGTRMPLLNGFKYIKDVELIASEIENSEPRMLLLGLESVSFDEENYNTQVTYRFLFADECIYEDDAIITSEAENIFCVSALSDFLRYVNDTAVEFGSVSSTTEAMGDRVFTTIGGTFVFTIKRSPSFWASMLG